MSGAGAVVWFTGLPAAGKSTLARQVATRLRARGREPLILDGDEVRARLRPPPGYDGGARDAFYASLAGLAALAAAQGVVVLVPATAHLRAYRDRARAATPRFVEVHVATSLDECRRRDPRGLYAGAAVGSTLPGVGVPYEAPAAPEVVVAPGGEDAAVDAVLTELDRLGA